MVSEQYTSAIWRLINFEVVSNYMQIIRFYVNIELFALLDSRSMETLKLLNADFSSMYAIINAIDIRSFHWR